MTEKKECKSHGEGSDMLQIAIIEDEADLAQQTKVNAVRYLNEQGLEGNVAVFNDGMDIVWLLQIISEKKSQFLKDNRTIALIALLVLALLLIAEVIINAPEEVKDSHVERVKKAYPAYFDTYAEMQTVIDYLNSIDNLYCIGRNGQHRYNNMDHSMATAFEAVELVTGKKEDRNALWNVNTEKEYHETQNA